MGTKDEAEVKKVANAAPAMLGIGLEDHKAQLCAACSCAPAHAVDVEAQQRAHSPVGTFGFAAGLKLLIFSVEPLNGGANAVQDAKLEPNT